MPNKAKWPRIHCGHCLDGCRGACALKCRLEQPGYRIKPPEVCDANRDGECYHPGCPQKLFYISSCPIIDHPEED